MSPHIQAKGWMVLTTLCTTWESVTDFWSVIKTSSRDIPIPIGFTRFFKYFFFLLFLHKHKIIAIFGIFWILKAHHIVIRPPVFLPSCPTGILLVTTWQFNSMLWFHEMFVVVFRLCQVGHHSKIFFLESLIGWAEIVIMVANCVALWMKIQQKNYHRFLDQLGIFRIWRGGTISGK